MCAIRLAGRTVAPLGSRGWAKAREGKGTRRLWREGTVELLVIVEGGLGKVVSFVVVREGGTVVTDAVRFGTIETMGWDKRISKANGRVIRR